VKNKMLTVREELFRSNGDELKSRFLVIIGMLVVYCFFIFLLHELGKEYLKSFELILFLLVNKIGLVILIIFIIMLIISYFNIDEVIIFENGLYIPFRALPSGIPFLFKNNEIIEWYSIRHIEKIHRGLVIHTIQNKSFLIPPQFNLNEIEERIKQHWTAPLEMDT